MAATKILATVELMGHVLFAVFCLVVLAPMLDRLFDRRD